MDYLAPILLFVLGIALIVKGGDFFVDAAVWIAGATGIPHFIVGATIVSLATTLPEIIVSVIAAASGRVDMAIGNAVGSVTANTGLILALSLLFAPAAVRRKELGFKGLLMIFSTLVLALVCLPAGGMTMFGGFIMFVIFVMFFGENIRAARIDSRSGTEVRSVDRRAVVPNVVKFVLGAAGIVAGAELLVRYGSELAKLLGASERLISLTFVAIGTSLPELVTTLTAIKKRQSSLSVGNILGANIIDLTLILPICTAVSGGTLPMSPNTLRLDIPAALLIMLVAILPALAAQRFRRWQGAAMLGCYAAYLGVLVFVL